MHFVRGVLLTLPKSCDLHRKPVSVAQNTIWECQRSATLSNQQSLNRMDDSENGVDSNRVDDGKRGMSN